MGSLGSEILVAHEEKGSCFHSAQGRAGARDARYGRGGQRGKLLSLTDGRKAVAWSERTVTRLSLHAHGPPQTHLDIEAFMARAG